MSTGPLSPVMLIASAGFIANPSTTLIANSDLSNAISTYQSYIEVGNVVSAALEVNVLANTTIITDTTFSSLVTMGNASVPALGDAVVANLAALTSDINDAAGNVVLAADSISNRASFTQVVQLQGNSILGNGDLSIFAQVYGMSQGYQAQTNTYINSTKNTDIISVTFTDMDALTTGGISQVTSNVSAFGSDLIKLGTTIDLSRLQYLGRPWLLLRQILQAGGMLPGLYNALNIAGVTDAEISSVQDNQPEITADLDKRIYNAFLIVTGDDLQQVCDLLDVTIPVSTIYKKPEYNFRRLEKISAPVAVTRVSASTGQGQRGPTVRSEFVEFGLIDTGTGIYQDLQGGSITGNIGAVQTAGRAYNSFKGSNLRQTPYVTLLGGQIEKINSTGNIAAFQGTRQRLRTPSNAGGQPISASTNNIDPYTFVGDYGPISIIKSEVRRIEFDRLESVPIEPTGKLETAADLLNPFKMLPNSWQTLITQIPSGTATQPTESVTVNIYNATGAVNGQISDFYRIDPSWLDLSRIIPSDQAAANLAWARGLWQIKNIINLTLPDLARSATAVETNQGLGDINSLNGSTGPVPQAVKDEIYNELSTGSGPNGTLLLEDFMGTVSGTPWTTYMVDVNSELASIANLTAFTDVANIYTVMFDMLNGDYGNTITGPITLPGDPTVYNNADEALQPLITNAVANIALFQSSYPSQSVTLNDLWINLGDRLILENDNLGLAQVNFGELRTNRSAALGLSTNLHSIGTNPTTSVFFESIANTQNQGGQAVIASMREGRNIDVLSKAGVGTDTQLSPK